jgi:cytochrome c
MRNSGITWTPETLDAFLYSPLEFLPGTSMGFAGIGDPVERRNLIAWLGTLNAESKLCVQ